MRWPVSLRTRLALQQTWSFAVLLLLLFWAAHEITTRSIERDFDDRVSDRSATIHSLLSVRDGSMTLVDSETDIEGNEALARAFYQVVDARGNVLAASGDAGLYAIPVTTTAILALTSHRSTWETVPLASGSRVRVLNRMIAGTDRSQSVILRVGVLMEEVDQRNRGYMVFFIIAIPIIVGIHGITAWEMSGRALRPLAVLTAAAQNIDSADLKRRFPESETSVELKRLTTALNDMIARIEGPFQHMREFLPNVSHELRRPLANLRAESEYALRRTMTVDEHRDVLAHQVETVDLITGTMSELMDIARCTSQPRRLTKQDQSISELIQASVDAMLPGAMANKIELTSLIPEGIMGGVDTCQICRALQNLIDNAIKYNREGGHVHVLVEQRNAATSILISDTGKGIPAAELPRIFDRSYRSIEARASGIQGSGLGLYFVKMVVEAHHGCINVDSVEGQGTSFRISLPGTRLVDNCDTCDTSLCSGACQH